MTDTESGETGGRPSPPRVARVVGGLAVALFWGALIVLRLVVGLPLADAILLSVLLVAVPGLSLAQLPLIELVPLERMQAYWSSIITLWVLGTASWFVGTRSDGAAAVGLAPPDWLASAVWAVFLTLGGLLTILVFRQLSVWTGKLDSRLLRRLLPRTREERSVFAILSVAAGFGEELAYRGYALTALVPLTGVLSAAVLTSIVFGVLHGYQGVLGMLRTGVMGGMLAWGFLASGSLWPPIFAHIAIDLLAGLWLGERLLSPRSV